MTLKERKERDVASIAAIVRILLIIGVSVAVVYGGLKVFFFLMPIIIGLVLATAASGSSRWIVKTTQKLSFFKPKPGSLGKNKVQQHLAVFLYILLFVLAGIFFTFVSIFIIRFLTSITRELPQWIRETPIIDQIMHEIGRLSANFGNILDEEAMASILETLKNFQSSLLRSLPQLAGSILSMLTGLFSSLPRLILIVLITVMSGFYFITQTDRLFYFTMRLIPDQKLVRKIFNLVMSLTSTLFRIIGGFILIMFITFVEAYIGFLIVKLPNALTWAVVTAVVDLLPILGISFTLIPMSIFFLISGETFVGVGILVLFVVMTILCRLFEPPIIGNAMSIHPLMTIFAMIVGIAVMGLGGLLVGPLVFFIAREIFITFNLEEYIRNQIGEMLHGDKSDPEVKRDA